MDDLATKLFPELSLHGNHENTTNITVLRIGKKEKTIEVPAMQAKEHYSAILNELVTHM